jgi:hypothetical protein
MRCRVFWIWLHDLKLSTSCLIGNWCLKQNRWTDGDSKFFYSLQVKWLRRRAERSRPISSTLVRRTSDWRHDLFFQMCTKSRGFGCNQWWSLKIPSQGIEKIKNLVTRAASWTRIVPRNTVGSKFMQPWFQLMYVGFQGEIVPRVGRGHLHGGGKKI